MTGFRESSFERCFSCRLIETRTNLFCSTLKHDRHRCCCNVHQRQQVASSDEDFCFRWFGCRCVFGFGFCWYFSFSSGSCFFRFGIWKSWSWTGALTHSQLTGLLTGFGSFACLVLFFLLLLRWTDSALNRTVVWIKECTLYCRFMVISF